MTTPLPSNAQPFVDNNRKITSVWQLFLAQFVSQPGPIETVTVGPSPFVFQASAAGSLGVIGGTVSTRALKRGTVSINWPSSFVPILIGDTVTVTYTVAPAISFVPG